MLSQHRPCFLHWSGSAQTSGLICESFPPAPRTSSRLCSSRTEIASPWWSLVLVLVPLKRRSSVFACASKGSQMKSTAGQTHKQLNSKLQWLAVSSLGPCNWWCGLPSGRQSISGSLGRDTTLCKPKEATKQLLSKCWDRLRRAEKKGWYKRVVLPEREPWLFHHPAFEKENSKNNHFFKVWLPFSPTFQKLWYLKIDWSNLFN